MASMITVPLSARLAAQTTIHVPADVATIQGGIDAAQNGDTVLVAPGTYTENLDFKGKAITVTSGATSFAGATGTVLQGTGNGPVVVFQTKETRASVLNGFTIQKGTSTAVYFSGASGTLSNNAIVNNLGCGVGISGQSASPMIVGNDIAYTGASATTGCAEAPPGTGIGLFQAGTVEITGNIIENNGTNTPNTGNAQLEYSPGTGIYAYSSTSVTTLLVESNIIRNNIASADGAAISTEGIAHVTIVQNLIYGNLASDGVPGINLDLQNFDIPKGITFSQIMVNNSIYGNVNVLAAQNHEAQTGNQADFGVTAPLRMSPFDVENNLFVATDQFGTVGCGTDSESTLTYQNNDVFYAGAMQPLQCTPSGSLLTVDPEFLDPATFNFQVQRTSPVVGAGDIDALNLPATDLAGKNRTVCGSIDMGVYQTHPQPPISLSSAPNSSVGGSSVTLSIHLTGNCNIPTGTVTLLDGAATLGTAVLDYAGNAVFSTAALTVGSHTLTVSYPGDFNFDPSTSNTVVQVVTGYPSTTTLNAVVPNPAQALQSISLTATVSSPFISEGGIPTGTVTFFAGTVALGTVALNAGGQATATTSTLDAGSYSITAVYNASTMYAASTSAALTEMVNGATTTTSLTSAPNPSSFGQSVTFTASVAAPQSAVVPDGTVVFHDGPATLGSATVSGAGVASISTSSLAVGSHTIVASYLGSANDNPSNSTMLVQVVLLAGTAVTLTGTPNPANVGTAVALVATVTPAMAGLPQPAGNVVFADQFGPLGTVPLTGGQATLTTATLASGTHAITASFVGSGSYGASVSPVLQEVIQPHDFSLTLSPATLTVASGQTGEARVVLTGLGSFTGAPVLVGSQAPMYGTLTFRPAQVSIGLGAASTSELSIKTSTPVQVARVDHGAGEGGRSFALVAFGCAALPLFLLRRRKVPALLAAMCAAVLISTFGGCGGVVYGTLNRVAPGVYSIPVTATDSNSNISHTVDLTLVVSP